MKKLEYRLSKHLSLEEELEGGDRIIINVLTGKRLRVSQEILVLLKHFKDKGSFQSACKHFSCKGISKRKTLRDLFDQLISATVLVRFDTEEVEIDSGEDLSVPSITFGNIPSVSKDQIKPGDIVFVGVPLDVAVTSYPGTRNGAQVIRNTSVEYVNYERDIFSGKSRGWLNADLGKRILYDKSLVDLGDIIIKPDEELGKIYKKIQRCAERIVFQGGLPVFLGGDHSLSAPIIKALANKHKGLTVIHLDAHTDFAPWTRGKPHHHGSFMTRVVKEAGIEAVYQYGIRGFSGEIPDVGKRVLIHSLSQQQVDSQFDGGGRVEIIPLGKKCYITFDVDALDPMFAPGVGTQVPLGFDPKRLLQLLKVIAEGNEIVGIDVVELNPMRDQLNTTSNLVFHMLTSLLSWSWDK